MIVSFDDPDLTKAYTREVPDDADVSAALLDLAREANDTDRHGVRDASEDLLRDSIAAYGVVDGEAWRGPDG